LNFSDLLELAIFKFELELAGIPKRVTHLSTSLKFLFSVFCLVELRSGFRPQIGLPKWTTIPSTSLKMFFRISLS